MLRPFHTLGQAVWLDLSCRTGPDTSQVSTMTGMNKVGTSDAALGASLSRKTVSRKKFTFGDGAAKSALFKGWLPVTLAGHRGWNGMHVVLRRRVPK